MTNLWFVKWEREISLSDSGGNILSGMADLGLFPLMDAYFRLASNQVMFHLLIYSVGGSKESSNNDVVLEHLIDLLILILFCKAYVGFKQIKMAKM